MKRQIRTYSNDKDLVLKRRTQITKGAIDVFLKNGYRGTTTRELAKLLGMSTGNLYRYIGSKEDILHLICLTAGPKELHELQEIVDTLSCAGASKTEILRQCFERYIYQADIVQDKNIFFNREIKYFSHSDRQLLLQSQVEHVHFFEKLILDGVNSGEFKIDCPLLLAHNIVIIGFDWGTRRWFLKKNFTLEEYTKINFEFILSALRVKTEYAISHHTFNCQQGGAYSRITKPMT